MLYSILLFVGFILYFMNIVLAFKSSQKRKDGRGRAEYFKRVFIGLALFILFGILLAIVRNVLD